MKANQYKDEVDEFIGTRDYLNELVQQRANKVIKRFFSLDSQTYKKDILDSKTKEMIGLACSMVLRCDDCIKYHLVQCFEQGLSTAEIVELLSVPLIVGGSIVIPHLRRAIEFWTSLEKKRFNKLAENIKEKVSELQNTSTGKDNNAVLQAICELCSDTIPYYNWFGFYIVSKEKENMLNLGPYSGEPTEHVKIPFGVGICGQAASSKKTYLIDDVSDEKNYLSCSINVKSEIVVPVFKEDTLVAEIDIDSHTKEAFTELDKKFLEELATIVVPFIELS